MSASRCMHPVQWTRGRRLVLLGVSWGYGSSVRTTNNPGEEGPIRALRIQVIHLLINLYVQISVDNKQSRTKQSRRGRTNWCTQNSDPFHWANKCIQQVHNTYMDETCQLCNIVGHTASTCPSLHIRCAVPNCDGVMISHNLEGNSFLKCHRETCSGYLPYAQLVGYQHSTTMTPCQVCGLTGHRPYECPSSRPYGQVADQSEIEMFEEPTQELLHQDMYTPQLCQICYDRGHNAQACSWLQMRCLIPNCDGLWIFNDVDTRQPLQAYNRECPGHKHAGIVSHNQLDFPTELLPCQICGIHAHEAYQCPDFPAFYHQIQQHSGLFCELCGAHTHQMQECPDALLLHQQLEVEEREGAELTTTTSTNNQYISSPNNS